MANIESVPSMGAETLPANAGTLVRGTQWGIETTLSGYIIQDINVNESRVTDVTQDQKGAVVSELDYDKRWDLSFTAIGGDGTEGTPAALEHGKIDFSLLNAKWKIDTCTYVGSYQDKKKWSVTAHKTQHFPAQA